MLLAANLYEDLKSPLTVAMLPLRWHIRFDPDGTGQASDGFHFQDQSEKWQPIEIRMPWESQGYPGYNGIAWYRTGFEVPVELEGRRLALKFNAVDDAADIWLNGKKVGEHRGHRKMPFEIEITEAAQFGQTNQVVVKVIDNSGQGGIWKRVWLKTIQE